MSVLARRDVRFYDQWAARNDRVPRFGEYAVARSGATRLKSPTRAGGEKTGVLLFFRWLMSVRGQNLIVVFREDDGRWWARVGVGDGHRVAASGHSACSALGTLVGKLHKLGYAFDAAWSPDRPADITF